MGQADVFEVLKENRGSWMCVKEVMIALAKKQAGVLPSRGPVYIALKKLCADDDVENNLGYSKEFGNQEVLFFRYTGGKS